MPDEPKRSNPLSAFDAESSCSESSDDEEEVVPVKKDTGLKKLAEELGIGTAGTKPLLHTQLRIRSPDEALCERISGLDTGYCDIDKQAEMVKRREHSEGIKKMGVFLLGVLKEIEDEFTQRGFTKGQKIEEFKPQFNAVYTEIAIKLMRAALNEKKDKDLPLKNFDADLYVMTGMMFGLFRGDEDYRFGSQLGRVSEQFVKPSFHTDAEYHIMNEQTKKTNEGQALKRKLADDNEFARKEREMEEKQEEEKKLEEQNDQDICSMLDALQFDPVEFFCRMAYEHLPEEEARRRCKADATKRRIEKEEARMRLPVSSPPRSVVDPSEWREVDLIEDDLANLNVQSGPTQADLYALIDKTKGFFAQDDDMEPVDMDISFDERDTEGERQEAQGPPEPTAEEIAARDRAISSMINRVRVLEQPDAERAIERYQRTRAESSDPRPVFSSQPVQPVQPVATRGRTELHDDHQQRGRCSPQYGDGTGEEEEADRSYEPSSPQYEPISPTYGSPTHGSPRYGDRHDDRDEPQPWVYRGEPVGDQESEQQPWVYRGDEPVEALPQPVQQRLNDNLQRRLQQQQPRDPRLEDPWLSKYPQDPRDPRLHRNELTARELRERQRFDAEQQRQAAYEAQQAAAQAAAHHAVDDDDVEMIGVTVGDRVTRLEPYKQRLTLDQMKHMTWARAEVEKKKWEAPTELAKIVGCGQKDHVHDFLVPLDDKFEGAITDEDRPRVRVNYGVRPGKKSILRVKRPDTPALLTDMHADKIPFPPTKEGQAARRQLVRLQRLRAEEPLKAVKIADENDERHKIRLYVMQAPQDAPQRDPISYDTTDDGYTRFHVTKQLCWQQDVLLPQSKIQIDDRFTYNISTLMSRQVAGSCSTGGWRKRRDNDFLYAPLAVPVTPAQDPIYTRQSADMSRASSRDPNYAELEVSHRDYKIIRAIKSMEDFLIEERWLRHLRLFVTHAFGYELSRDIGTSSPANSGLSYLVFTDSLLDRVNTFRFPQAHFVIHQKPLNLSTSFRVLCDEIPFEKLLNIEYFVFAYGFDEILFGGECPRVVAATVMAHCVATASLVHQARAILRHSHRYTIVPKYRIMRLPTYRMDKGWKKRLLLFNDYLNSTLAEFSRQNAQSGQDYMEDFFPIQLLDWETEDIVKRTIADGIHREGGNYRYNCIESFALSMKMHLNMQTLRPYPKGGNDDYEFHQQRQKVSGISEKVFRENY